MSELNPIDLTDELIAETYQRVIQVYNNILYDGFGRIMKQQAFDVDENNDMRLNERYFGDPIYEMDANGDTRPRRMSYRIDENGNTKPVLFTI